MIRAALRRKGDRRNRIVVIGLGVVFGIAFLIFLWFGVQNAQYRTQFAQHMQEMNKIAAGAPEALKQFKETPDAAKQAASLDTLAATLLQKGKAAPSRPNILGLALGTDGEYSKQARMQAAAEAFAAKLKEEAAFISYQAVVARNLQVLSLKTAVNHDQVVALAAAWRQSIESIKQAAIPSKLTYVSATLTQKMTSIYSIILQLADLYKANDTAGFTAKQKEFAAATEAFRPLSAAVQQAATSLDSELSQAFTTFRQNL